MAAPLMFLLGAFLLQGMSSSLMVVTTSEDCYPCEVRIQPLGGQAELKFDIYVPNVSAGEGPRPVVVAHHGRRGSVKTLKEHCTYVFAPAGFVCAAVEGFNTAESPTYLTDFVIGYIRENAELFKADASTIFLYGHSRGGRSVFEYMFSGEGANRDSVKGFFQDASSNSSDRYDWGKKVNGTYLKFPPLLMLHCEGDRTVRPTRSVERTVSKIDTANQERGDHEQIVCHYMKFATDTGCSHAALLVNSWDGADAAVSMVRSIVDGGEDPVAGFPTEVSGSGKATGSRRRRGEANWWPDAEPDEVCYPCEVRIHPPGGRPELQLDIYVPNVSAGGGPRPVVMAHHGEGHTVKTMAEQCTYVFAPAGFVCAAIDPLNTQGRPAYFTDYAIGYLRENAKLYSADASSIFLYGHSRGGRSVFEYMFFSEDANRDSVKGLIQDASSESSDRYDWWRKVDGAYLPFPPLLMLHCEADSKVEPEQSVDVTVAKMDAANQDRGDHEQIVYHSMKFATDTGCSHAALLVNSWDGADTAVSMIRSIAGGDEDPFAGFPAEVSGPGKATWSRRRRGEANWP